VDWDEFNKALADSLTNNPISTDINSTDEYDSVYLALDKTLQTTIASHVPRLSLSPYAKRWWTKELTILLDNTRKMERENRKRPCPEAETAAQEAVKLFKSTLETTKKQHWKDWLEHADEKSVWLASRYANRPFSDGSAERIPALKRADG
ncbi:hypothetical protein R3P38DRAFT_2409867, partial [Favolaschia claudopus]